MLNFIIYETTNLINGKKYIGSHSTEDLNDGYLGSGKLLKRAIKKYGKDSFKIVILAKCQTSKDMFDLEFSLVTEEWVKNPNTYNLKIGGEGGWDFVNKNPHLRWTDEKRKKYSIKMKQNFKNGKNNLKPSKNGFKGKHHSLEAKKLISENSKMKLSQSEIDARIEQWNSVEDKIGKNKKLSIIWGISHTQVRRFVNKYIKLNT